MKLFKKTFASKIVHFGIISCFALAGCSQVGEKSPTVASKTTKPSFILDYESYQLDNGLTVILHTDHSDPVVAVSLSVNVGSAREKPGRTGLAHLFEHLLFLNSENLGYGGLDELGTRIGGSGSNGFTQQHLTQYFQSGPSDTLEKLIWAEAEKLGFFINTVTQNALDVERQVVKNEKRQNVDDVPYGSFSEVMSEHMYPADHPYHWQVLGSLDDLEAATLEDVKQFYKKWYVPNNAALVIAGHFDSEQAKEMVEKYFAEIPRGNDIEAFTPRPAKLDTDINVYHQDKLASVPLLGMSWPTVDNSHTDFEALSLLGMYLSFNQKSPLTQVMVHEDEVTLNVNSGHFSNILAGEFEISAEAKAEQDLDVLLASIYKGLDQFEHDGVDAEQLNRIINTIEASYYGGIETVGLKASYMGSDAVLYGDPNKTVKDLAKFRAVTPQKIIEVYRKYIKNKAKLMVSFVPQNQQQLALKGSSEVQVKQGNTSLTDIVVEFHPESEQHVKTPSKIDRSEPPYGETYTFPTINVWQTTLDNGIAVSGIFNDETPRVAFRLSFPAGNKFADNRYSILTPRYTALILRRGTQSKNYEEFERTLRDLNSNISSYATDHEVVISGSAYADRLDATLALLEEMLLRPRWDEDELRKLKERGAERLIKDQTDNAVVARKANTHVSYSKEHIRRQLSEYDVGDIRAVSMNELKQFYNEYYHPNQATFNFVGVLNQQQVTQSLGTLAKAWEKSDSSIDMPAYTSMKPLHGTEFFVKPIDNASQSSIRVSAPSISTLHPDYPKLKAVNLLLGGVFTSILNQKLRVEKGYTYGIGSSFNANKYNGSFSLSTRVRSNATYDSLKTIKSILDNYADNLTEEDLRLIKDSITRYEATTSESLGSKLQLLNQIKQNNYPLNYKQQHVELIQNLTLDELKQLTRKYLQPDKLRWVVAAPSEQLNNLDSLGLGKPVVL